MEKNCDEQEAELGDHVRQMPNLPDLDTDRRFEQCTYEKAYYYRWIHLTIHGFVSHMSNLLAKLLTNWLDSVMHKSFRVN